MTSRENRIYLYGVNVIFYGYLNKKSTTRERMQEEMPIVHSIVHSLHKSVQCSAYLHQYGKKSRQVWIGLFNVYCGTSLNSRK